MVRPKPPLTPARREAAVRMAEHALVMRTDAADLRDEALTGRELAMNARAAASEQSDGLLREANERLVIATVNAQTMTELAEQASAQMAFMAEDDFLTGLPNRALLTDRLAQSIVLARRHGTRVGLMYVDLDHFKNINDSLGHGVGDKLLQSVSLRLQSCVRSSDTVSRQGGDEFVVLLSEMTKGEDAAQAAEKLKRAMAAPHLIDGHRLHVTLSIGVSTFPDDGPDAESLMGNADLAMYNAKHNGRNGYRVFTADMNHRAVTRQSVEQSLHHALEHHEFVLEYQPKVDLKTNTITGAEALIRLQRGPELVGPQNFVSVAEESGLIVPIGRWVLHEACSQMATWLRDGLQLAQIAVNVSAIEFHGKEFLANLKAVLEETGLEPGRLELELTESGLIRDTLGTSATLAAIRALGGHVAIDDFGTGYSSLSYLRRFAIDTLKIDQSFVREIDAKNENPIVTAVIAMGLSLRYRVVAEGIETSEQLAFLGTHHCAEGQGYLFSRPVSAQAFEALLTRPVALD
jgi:diguanylate cyclase